jgi:membrane associated rhomboid family serine protease
MHDKSEGKRQTEPRHIDKRINDDIGEVIDEYDLYYGENAEKEITVEKAVPPGPLSKRPAVESAIPFFIISFLFIVCTYLSGKSSFHDYMGASRETVFLKKEYWRLLTAVFTHSGSVHLLSNIPLFFFFGLFLYEYFGILLFPVIPLLIGMLANAITLYFYPDTVMLIGASGMVYGMASLWLILYIYHDTDHTVPVRIFRSIGFTLIVLFPTTYDPSTSYMAHAAGFVLGILSAVLILPFIKVKVRIRG